MELTPKKRDEFMRYVDSTMDYIQNGGDMVKEAIPKWVREVPGKAGKVGKFTARAVYEATLGNVSHLPSEFLRWTYPIKSTRALPGKVDAALHPFHSNGRFLDTGSKGWNTAATVLGRAAGMTGAGFVARAALSDPDYAPYDKYINTPLMYAWGATPAGLPLMAAFAATRGWLMNRARHKAGLPVFEDYTGHEDIAPGIAEKGMYWLMHPKDSVAANGIRFILDHGITVGPNGFNIPKEVEQEYPETCAAIRKASPMLVKYFAQAASAGPQGILDWIHNTPFLPDILTTALEGFFRNRTTEGIMDKVRETAPSFATEEMRNIVRQAVEENVNGYEGGRKRHKRSKRPSDAASVAFTDAEKVDAENYYMNGGTGLA